MDLQSDTNITEAKLDFSLDDYYDYDYDFVEATTSGASSSSSSSWALNRILLAVSHLALDPTFWAFFGAILVVAALLASVGLVRLAAAARYRHTRSFDLGEGNLKGEGEVKVAGIAPVMKEEAKTGKV